MNNPTPIHIAGTNPEWTPREPALYAVRCYKCRDYRYQANTSSRCPDCTERLAAKRRERVASGYQQCRQCLKLHKLGEQCPCRSRRIVAPAELSPQERRRYVRSAAGLCVDCGMLPPEAERLRCNVCLEKMRIRSRACKAR